MNAEDLFKKSGDIKAVFGIGGLAACQRLVPEFCVTVQSHQSETARFFILIRQGEHGFAVFGFAVFERIQYVFVFEAAEFAVRLYAHRFHGIDERKRERDDHSSEEDPEKDHEAPPGTSDQLPDREFTFDRRFFARQYPAALRVVSDLSGKQLDRIFGKKSADAEHRGGVVDQRGDDNAGNCHPYRQMKLRLHRLIIGKPERAERRGQDQRGDRGQKSSDNARDQREQTVMAHQL